VTEIGKLFRLRISVMATKLFTYINVSQNINRRHFPKCSLKWMYVFVCVCCYWCLLS